MVFSFKKFALAIGFLSFSCCWGLDSKIDDFEVFSLDKIDKTKIPAITLKPMDLGKVGLELEIENNRYSLTLDPKGKVDKTILPEEYRDLFLDSKGFSWLIPSQNLYLNSTSWFKEQQFTKKEIAIRINSIDVEKPSNLIFSFVKQEYAQCEIKTGQLFNFDYLKLHGVDLNNEKENSKINILECEECGVFTGEKLATLNHLIGVRLGRERFALFKEDKSFKLTKDELKYLSEKKIDFSLLPHTLSRYVDYYDKNAWIPPIENNNDQDKVDCSKTSYIARDIVSLDYKSKFVRLLSLSDH